jgi:hypothetical protein
MYHCFCPIVYDIRPGMANYVTNSTAGSITDWPPGASKPTIGDGV